MRAVCGHPRCSKQAMFRYDDAQNGIHDMTIYRCRDHFSKQAQDDAKEIDHLVGSPWEGRWLVWKSLCGRSSVPYDEFLHQKFLRAFQTALELAECEGYTMFWSSYSRTGEPLSFTLSVTSSKVPYHCGDMRDRFPRPQDKEEVRKWLSINLKSDQT